MKKNPFILELIKSPPFLLLIILTALILAGVLISNKKDKAVRMKEDVLYIQPSKK